MEGYRCSYSRVCIPLSQLCDDKTDCPHSDDERMCDFECPINCTCSGYAVECRKTSYNVMTQVSYTARKIDISYSAYSYGTLTLQKNLPFLANLNASHCNIVKIGDFGKSVNIINLDISYNRISKIQANTFVLLKRLKKLSLEGNFLLAMLESNSFAGIKITELEIKHTRLTVLLPRTFAGLNLKKLDISYNRIKIVNGFAFENLNVEHLLISEKFISMFDSNLFTGIGNLKLLKTPAYKFCCIKPFNFPQENCFPQQDEFSSCDDLMKSRTLQALLWTIGLLSLLGNILSVVYRIIYDRKRLKLGYGIFVTNLAVADFLMGVYLMMIAAADAMYRDRYIEVDEYWRNSVWCKMAGFLSTVSSEMSVMLICCITIDRILVIKYPFGTIRFKPLSATVAGICCWVLASFVAVLPLSGIEYFGNAFYGRSAVCLALPLTRQKTPGWQYSIVVFIGLNFILFLLIAMGQLLIYGEIKKHAALKRKMNVARSNDLTVARNLLLLVLTDFMCWFPIGCMGIMALRGSYVPAEVYAWTAVLILPINSALNPFLYTFSTVLGKKNFNPDVEEQDRSDLSKDIALAVTGILPYFSMRPCRRHALGKQLEGERMANREKFCVVNHLVRCIDCLHSNELVLRKITVDSIFVRLQLPSNKVAGIQVEQPSVCKNKTERAENMYQLAVLVRQLFPEL
ncbi:G-protein coupled receptor GRL101-like [Mercenaria mercenaria]|uniref:G-protein coupled receptor GRL101-like n=1 Tax=Mercenaria mercenaria TaxID=6596 RepID=UPI00234EEEBC|nr:G-protein coupled receptor GRL101-like [Mercenaria mercenaria]